MPQDRDCGRKAGFRLRPRKRIFRWVAGVALLGIAAGIDVSGASAQTYGSDNEGAWNKFMKSLGMNSAPSASGDINYTERSPLVVPPSRDLPPPGSEAATPAPDWPKNDPKPVKHAKAKGKPDVVPDTAVQTLEPTLRKEALVQSGGLVQYRRIRYLCWRTSPRELDRSACRVSCAVAGSPLRHLPGEEENTGDLKGFQHDLGHAAKITAAALKSDAACFVRHLEPLALARLRVSSRLAFG